MSVPVPTKESMASVESVVNRILSEDILTMAQANAEFSKWLGSTDKCKIYRWVHHGVGGVKLEAIQIGHQLVTSKQAIVRFVVARTAQTVGEE